MATPPNKFNMERKKVSETFIEFAQPTLKPILKESPSITCIYIALFFPKMVWNDIIWDHVRGNDNKIKQLRFEYSQLYERIKLLEELIERKKTLFPNEIYIIGDYNVDMTSPGKFNIHVNALDPYSKKDTK